MKPLYIVIAVVGGILLIISGIVITAQLRPSERSKNDIIFITDTPPTPTQNYKPTQIPTLSISPTRPQEKAVVQSYTAYSADTYEKASTRKRVLFFAASWCPTCTAADVEFTKNNSGIPEDIVIFKTDYDTETALKKQYGITYQHTFVHVDENGTALNIWNGGGIAEIITNTR